MILVLVLGLLLLNQIFMINFHPFHQQIVKIEFILLVFYINFINLWVFHLFLWIFYEQLMLLALFLILLVMVFILIVIIIILYKILIILFLLHFLPAKMIFKFMLVVFIITLYFINLFLLQNHPQIYPQNQVTFSILLFQQFLAFQSEVYQQISYLKYFQLEFIFFLNSFQMIYRFIIKH